MTRAIYFFILTIFSLSAFAQTWEDDNFTIGIYSWSNSTDHTVPGQKRHYFLDHEFTSPLTSDFYSDSIRLYGVKIPTSIFNVLSEDGFNMALIYDSPDKEKSRKMLRLANSNGMRFIFDYKGEFLPTNVPNMSKYFGHVEGSFIFDPPIDANRPNFRLLYDSVFANPIYNAGLWGIQIAEEPSATHAFSINKMGKYCDQNYNLITNGCVHCAVPPKALSNAADTINAWNRKSGIGVPAIISEASHGGIIDNFEFVHDTTWQPDPNDRQHSPYFPHHYVTPDSMNVLPKVYFNSSYINYTASSYGSSRFVANDTSRSIRRAHYLGRYMSIDYIKQYYNTEIEGIYAEEWSWPYPNSFKRGVSDLKNSDVKRNVDDYIDPATKSGAATHLHTDLSSVSLWFDKKNANGLWFQAYTSIIHGTDGIILWKFPNWKATVKDSLSHDKLGRMGLANPYKREYFPETYSLFIAPLTRELRWLSDHKFIGRASKELFKKTSHSDNYCVVPPVQNYMYQIDDLATEKKDEYYGLRYVVNANPDGEVVMIISNPLMYPIDSVWLDFSNLGNLTISQADSVEVLFTSEKNPRSHFYKVARSATIFDNGELKTSYKIPLKGDSLKLAFGALDVHVIRFVPNKIVNTQFNHWKLEWSNEGDGTLGGATIQAEDTFYIGDFLGTGTDQLMVMQTKNGHAWLSMHSYNLLNKDWEWLWSNYGNLQHPFLQFKKSMVVGDFNGNGKDEIFAFDKISGTKLLFEFNTSNFEWDIIWQINPTDHFANYKEHFLSGDFDGDGDQELLSYNIPGWTTEYRYDNNSNNFVWGNWSDLGNNYLASFRNDFMRVGDFDGDGRDEIVGFKDSFAAIFKFNNKIWNWDTIWQNTTNNIGGWGLPLFSSDALLVGNIDEDARHELLFIQTGPQAGWAASLDFAFNPSLGRHEWTWNWSANNISSIDHIRDWPINDLKGFNSEYFLFKVSSTQPDYLLAKRRFGCHTWADKHLINLYHTQSGNNYKAKFEADTAQKDKLNRIAPSPKGVVLFPNPADDIINIQTIGDEELIEHIRISSLDGKEIYNEFTKATDIVNISLKDLKSGVWVAEIKTSKGLYRHRLIKQL